MAEAMLQVEALPVRGSYLDVATGRGEMLDYAESIGFNVVKGTEIVPILIDGARVVRAEAHALPFKTGEFEVVSMFDVIEHLVPGDDELACKELLRVASRHILLTANNHPSFNPETKEDLHINKRPYEEWDAMFREWFPGNVTWLSRGISISEAWRVDL